MGQILNRLWLGAFVLSESSQLCPQSYKHEQEEQGRRLCSESTPPPLPNLRSPVPDHGPGRSRALRRRRRRRGGRAPGLRRRGFRGLGRAPRRAPAERCLPLRLPRLPRRAEPPEQRQHGTLPIRSLPFHSPRRDAAPPVAPAGREPGVAVAGAALHLVHGVRGGGFRGGAADGVPARPRRRHLRLPPLHRRQPRPVLVRAPPQSSLSISLFGTAAGLAGISRGSLRRIVGAIESSHPVRSKEQQRNATREQGNFRCGSLHCN
jgi:hypothetical protein